MTFWMSIEPSPWGGVAVAVDDAGNLHRVAFLPSARALDPISALRLGNDEVREHQGRTAHVTVQLRQYFDGARTAFDLPLQPFGTPFQLEVWRALRTIPFGETRSYRDIAQNLGKPGAARAVGRANATNPLPIVVPCHRVIGADGSLTGFGGGLPFKRGLLKLENVATAATTRRTLWQ